MKIVVVMCCTRTADFVGRFSKYIHDVRYSNTLIRIWSNFDLCTKQVAHEVIIIYPKTVISNWTKWNKNKNIS